MAAVPRVPTAKVLPPRLAAAIERAATYRLDDEQLNAFRQSLQKSLPDSSPAAAVGAELATAAIAFMANTFYGDIHLPVPHIPAALDTPEFAMLWANATSIAVVDRGCGRSARATEVAEELLSLSILRLLLTHRSLLAAMMCVGKGRLNEFLCHRDTPQLHGEVLAHALLAYVANAESPEAALRELLPPLAFHAMLGDMVYHVKFSSTDSCCEFPVYVTPIAAMVEMARVLGARYPNAIARLDLVPRFFRPDGSVIHMSNPLVAATAVLGVCGAKMSNIPAGMVEHGVLRIACTAASFGRVANPEARALLMGELLQQYRSGVMFRYSDDVEEDRKEDAGCNGGVEDDVDMGK
jgi:hypothetical protein